MFKRPTRRSPPPRPPRPAASARQALVHEGLGVLRSTHLSREGKVAALNALAGAAWALADPHLCHRLAALAWVTGQPALYPFPRVAAGMDLAVRVQQPCTRAGIWF